MGVMDELIDAAALERLRNQLQAASDIDFPQSPGRRPGRRFEAAPAVDSLRPR